MQGGTSMKTDIEIAQEAQMLPITEVVKEIGLTADDLELYGKYKAKISNEYLKKIEGNKKGKLILVTAINPTPAGEGKTTTSVGLGQAFGKLGKKAVIALREPSLGPCFGIKGGAAGGGYAQVVPMEDLNLHFTGDFHAITSANNLLAALLDNHIQQGNALRIDTRQIVWKRCLDMNDRVLRNVVVGLGSKTDGFVREDHFVITVASEIMAILCLATDLEDLKERLGKIIVAYDLDGKPVTAKDLQAVGAMAALLKDAILPNVIQTLEHTPALVHGGPFANIAHGCNSVRATTAALSMADYVVTEAGFGADLGAEKFFDIKCRQAGLSPVAVVQVGNDPASSVYVNNKKKACAYTGMESESFELPEETTQEELLSLIEELNGRKEINGILVQLPLPKHIDENAVIRAISPKKDVDGFHPQSVGALCIGQPGFVSCTPAGIIELLKRSGIEIAGKECVIIGRSNIVGKPMALLMLRENATVTITHSKTKDLKDVCKRADILIVAIGKPQMITEEYVKEGAVVIDVGIHRREEGLCGDVDFERVSEHCSYITPVPGGVGPMTIAMLMHNCVESVTLQTE